MIYRIIYLFVAVAAALLFMSCQSDNQPQSKPDGSEEGVDGMSITITSAAFDEGAMIPSQYTCDGEDISPPLKIEGVPDDAKSLALICDDPDAPMGTWVHWVLYNLPAKTTDLPENMPADEKLEGDARHGVTDFKRFGYGGPCPPSGTHRYFFKVYALDIMLDLSGRVTKGEVEAAMKGHVLAEGQLMGKYRRQ